MRKKRLCFLNPPAIFQAEMRLCCLELGGQRSSELGGQISWHGVKWDLQVRFGNGPR